jgi:conjugal transfer pilus assembly protein TrbC
MRLLTSGIVALLGTAGLSALLAQSVDGVDVQAVKKRAADMAAEAQAFVDQVKDRGDEFREQASVVRKSGIDNMQRVAATDLPKGPGGKIDFDEFVQGAATNANVPGAMPRSSSSSPACRCRRLAQAADRRYRAGWRRRRFPRLPQQLGQGVRQPSRQVVQKGDMPNIGIDPRLFRAFDVQAVPTYVAVSSTFDLCAGFHCQTKVPPHDRIEGNVTVDYALNTFAEANGPGARIASVALGNLARSRRQ